MDTALYITPQRKKLLILDINGILCYKANTNTAVCNSSTLPVIFKTKYYEVILRPYAKEFLREMFELYNVAFFTSTTERNADKILQNILTKQQSRKTFFKWYRDKTHADPTIIPENPTELFETLKMLEDVFNLSKVINAGYDYTNTLLCDDSKFKVRYNPKQNVLICESFLGNSNDTYLKDFIHYIAEKFANM